MISFHLWTLLQCLILIKTRSARPHQVYVTGAAGRTSALPTGTTNQAGMTFADNTVSTEGYKQMKDFGIEDLWGNLQEYVDGVFLDQNRNVLTAFQGFNDTGAGYTNNGPSVSADLPVSYMKTPVGTTEAGFIAVDGIVSGNVNAPIWHAICSTAANSILLAGRAYNQADGPFSSLSYPVSARAYQRGTRLMYL